MLQPAVIQVRLNAVTTSLTTTANTLDVLADTLDTPFLGAIVNTTQAVLKNIESETGAELPPNMESAMISPSLADMKKDAQKRHQEVLNMIETLSENTVSERGSMVKNPVV
ncbi:hypothetical protein B0H14DRAFT_3140651 [Mycena olivaceomarginata]|nr:hypothetical protein B0H14DRAFT_3140651 [Mycena olivaceomarginata]